MNKETSPTNVAVEMAALTKRVAALETALAVIAAEKKNSGTAPSGKFAAAGGIERHVNIAPNANAEPIDFSNVGGKVVRVAHSRE